jgi:hypothetical protein
VSEQEEKPATAPESAPQQPKKKGGVIGLILGVIVVIAVVVGGGLAYMYLTGDMTTAKEGDCITETVKQDASDAKVVDCSKPEAKNKVIGIVENVPETAMEDQDKAQAICDAKYPTWENVIWRGKPGGTGEAWCLEKIK